MLLSSLFCSSILLGARDEAYSEIEFLEWQTSSGGAEWLNYSVHSTWMACPAQKIIPAKVHCYLHKTANGWGRGAGPIFVFGLQFGIALFDAWPSRNKNGNTPRASKTRERFRDLANISK